MWRTQAHRHRDRKIHKTASGKAQIQSQTKERQGKKRCRKRGVKDSNLDILFVKLLQGEVLLILLFF